LHDTIKDSPRHAAHIKTTFGSEVAPIVAATTEDATIDDFAQRKASLRRPIAAFRPDASVVYAADKVAKVRELRSDPRRKRP
jgi:(p)ppGpp synthase/HD superfamily hydrolase